MKNIKSLMDMHGRVSLITGGAGYLGRAMGETLAELGSEIVLLDINEENTKEVANEISKNTGVKVSAYCCDLENESELREVPGWIEQNFGRLDVLVNNAAFVGTSGLEGWVTDFDNQSADTWRRAMEVNLTSVFILSQGCRKLLEKSRNGTIINISSIYGVLGPDLSLYDGTSMNNPAAYSASKGGLIQFSKWLSTVLAPNIRVNTISPGGVIRGQPEIFIDRYVKRTPLSRMATEEDFKGSIAYLASDMSKYVTGINLMVDGGWSVW